MTKLRSAGKGGGEKWGGVGIMGGGGEGRGTWRDDDLFSYPCGVFVRSQWLVRTDSLAVCCGAQNPHTGIVVVGDVMGYGKTLPSPMAP